MESYPTAAICRNAIFAATAAAAEVDPELPPKGESPLAWLPEYGLALVLLLLLPKLNCPPAAKGAAALPLLLFAVDVVNKE